MTKKSGKPGADKHPERQSISTAGKIGFLVLVLLLAAGGAYFGLRMSSSGDWFSQGARFEDLPKEQQERISALAGGVKQNPGNLTIHSRFCHAFLEGRLLKDAESCYKEILAIDGSSPDALIHLGEAAFYRNQFAESLGYYNRAIAVDPENVHAYFNRGYLRMKGLKDYREARDDLEKFIELSKDNKVDFQVTYLIQQLNELIGDKPGLSKKGRELVINPNDIVKSLTP